MQTPFGPVQWQPLNQLLLLSEMVYGAKEHTQEVYDSFLQAREKSHVLPGYHIRVDATLNHAQRVYDEQSVLLDVYEAQLTRWLEMDNPSAQQTSEIQALQIIVAEVKEMNTTVLNLVEELRKGTINRIIEMDPAELMLAMLTGKIKPPTVE